jgi:hypothetical protein
MQVMWMVLVTLGLALGGILGLAVRTQVTAWPGAGDFSPPRPLPVHSSSGGTVRALALEPGASKPAMLDDSCRCVLYCA